MQQQPRCIKKTGLAICVITLVLQLTGCYDHAQAAAQQHLPCLPERDIALQSHFMIWQMCHDDQ